MTITLYKTTSPAEMVTKTLTGAKSVSLSLKTPVDVLHPVLVLGGVDITGYNYAYIRDFNKYYFINQLETGYAQINERKLEVDVLMTYAAEIRSLYALVERQEKYYNLYLPDLRIPNYSYKRVQTKQFPQQPLNVGGTMILAVMGKGAT